MDPEWDEFECGRPRLLRPQQWASHDHVLDSISFRFPTIASVYLISPSPHPSRPQASTLKKRLSTSKAYILSALPGTLSSGKRLRLCLTLSRTQRTSHPLWIKAAQFTWIPFDASSSTSRYINKLCFFLLRWSCTAAMASCVILLSHLNSNRSHTHTTQGVLCRYSSLSILSHLKHHPSENGQSSWRTEGSLGPWPIGQRMWCQVLRLWQGQLHGRLFMLYVLAMFGRVVQKWICCVQSRF